MSPKKRSYKMLTVSRLRKALDRLIENGHSRRYVCVSKETFQDNRESDGVTILAAYDCRLETIPKADDDGGLQMNMDGSERLMTVAIIFGNADEANQ